MKGSSAWTKAVETSATFGSRERGTNSGKYPDGSGAGWLQ